MISRQYYVYVHRKKTNNEIFYVGKGFNNRCFSKSDRSLSWKNTVNKHGYVVEIVQSGLQEWYAFELEKELILKYGKKCEKSGILVNYTDGGEGSSGRKHSEYTINKLKIKAKQRSLDEDWKRKVSRINSKHSEDTKRKIKLSSLSRRHTPESRLKIAESNRDNNIYKFINDEGDIFIGTRLDFYFKYSLNIKPLFKSNPSYKAKGWRRCYD